MTKPSKAPHKIWPIMKVLIFVKRSANANQNLRILVVNHIMTTVIVRQYFLIIFLTAWNKPVW